MFHFLKKTISQRYIKKYFFVDVDVSGLILNLCKDSTNINEILNKGKEIGKQNDA